MARVFDSLETIMPLSQAARGSRRASSTPLRGAAAAALALACACQWNERWGDSGRIVFSRDGVSSTLTLPGPNPTGVSGIATDPPEETEENLVTVTRIGGRVQVRPPRERGFRGLDHTKPRLQTGPGAVIVTYPNATAQVDFSDDSHLFITHSAEARFTDPAKGGTWVAFDRLTVAKLTGAQEARFLGLTLPGGAEIRTHGRARLAVSLERERYYLVRNEGEVPFEVRTPGGSRWVRPADSAEVPVIRNAPAEASAVPGARVGEAVFPGGNVAFDPILPGLAPAKGSL